MATIYDTLTGKIIVSKELTQSQIDHIISLKPNRASRPYTLAHSDQMRINLISLEAEAIPPQVNAIEHVREQRSYLLAASDWTQNNDSPLDPTAKADWKAYRKALRDLTKGLNPNKPISEIEWPIPPQ